MTRFIRCIPAFVLATAACQGPAPPPQADQPSAPASIEGAWRLVSLQEISESGDVTEVPLFENLILINDGFYSIAFSRGDQASPYWAERWVPTEEERLDRWMRILVNTGTYELTDQEFITHPVFALVPEFVGGTARYDHALSGDELTLTVTDVVSVDGVRYPLYEEGGKAVSRLERIQ